MQTVINTFDEGWYSSFYPHNVNNQNTTTGSADGALFNSFFAFDLSGLDKLVTSAKFRVQTDAFGAQNVDVFERLSLWDVTAPVAVLVAGQGSYFDLQGGVNYASFTFEPLPSTTYEIQLTPAAVAAINLARGTQFAIGAHLDTQSTNQYVRFGANYGSDAISELVLEVNDPPISVILSNAAVAEHSPAGTVIGTLATSDGNASDPHSYQLLSNGGGPFALAGDGRSLVLLDGTSFDFEQTAAYALVVRSTDPYGLYVDQPLTITLADLVREFGSSFDDVLVGGPQRDFLMGLDGNDVLTGWAGRDVLVGGLGRDVMTGGRGADVFDFNHVKDSGRKSATRDVITDFKRGIDHIDLRGIDAMIDHGGNNKFVFISFQGFSKHSGELRLKDAGSNIILQGDVTGDGRSDFEILVRNVASLHATDFYV